ncbi:MAG: EutN/CcmL family microcompartment protein [Rhodothermales bacterium]|nr:EutN/CcmL family microcompartment protein [Rhodothermales bacterium]
MKLARVIGTIWATRKDDRLDSRRMLLVQPMSFGGKDRGRPITALDSAEAGVGDLVIYTTASEAAIPFRPGLTPTDATVVGVVDRVDHAEWSFVAAG